MAKARSARAPVQLVGAADAALLTDPLWARLDAFARARDFHHWTYSAGPACDDVSTDPTVTLTTYPETHTRVFFARRLDLTNPGRRYAGSNRNPATYAAIRESALPPSPPVAVQLALNRAHDVTRGIVIPLHDVLGLRASMGLAYRGSETQLADALPGLEPEILAFARATHADVQRRHAARFLEGRVPRLTARQQQVVRGFADGLANAEVADRLGLSIHTVDKHAAHIKTRLGARSLAQATALALRWGLLD